jgi:hypothetical protein
MGRNSKFFRKAERKQQTRLHTSNSLLPKSSALEVQITIETLLGTNRHVLINVGSCCRNLKKRESVENQEEDAG